MANYLNRIRFILFYFLNARSFKYLAYKAVIYPSVRINGKKYISIADRAVVQRCGWLFALKIGDVNPVLHIGRNCAIGDFSHIVAVGEVIIEDNVLIANNVYISDNVHAFEDVNKPIMNQKVRFKKAVKIQQGAWLGENVCVIGASVGKNSVIGANSVVTKDIPDFCIAVGSPAKIIKAYHFETQKWVSIE
ncbi:acyltransferase [Mucilaginibacter sp. McL0603]|uniref:acyltransferase n=1 Tax=Mucilaginibacter sp. McL0603 TaxID=3415670 RepID=UPI003CF94147